jgi:hypothetical protein
VSAVRGYTCPRRCGRRTMRRHEACCAECHWHAVDPLRYPFPHSQPCNFNAKSRKRPAPPSLRPLLPVQPHQYQPHDRNSEHNRDKETRVPRIDHPSPQ